MRVIHKDKRMKLKMIDTKTKMMRLAAAAAAAAHHRGAFVV